MGLDTSHDCWHGAYSAFKRWRDVLAKAAGYYLWKVETDFGGGICIPVEMPMLEWHRYQNGEQFGEWKETPSDPLIVLLVHADCEGVIHPAQAIPLADRLEELLPALLDMRDVGHIAARGGLVAVTEKFIAGLRAAAAAGEDVDFH